MLYSMSKNGEDIEPLRQQFTFTKAQNVQLDGAKLPLKEEAEHLLDYSQTLDIVTLDDHYICESHLVSLGEPAKVALKQRLQLLLQNKPTFTNRSPITCIVWAASMTGDQNFLPLLKRFVAEMRDSKPSLSAAVRAEQRLEDNLSFSFAPQ